MAFIFLYLAEFSSFQGPLCKSGWRYTDTFRNRNTARTTI